MKVIKNIILTLAIAGSSLAATAQSTPLETARKHGWEFELRAGANFGGTMPIPLPVEIRAIKGYNPGLNGFVEAIATKWFDPQGPWGIMMGLSLEGKGMKSDATTKNYITSVENGGKMIDGRYTGDVHTEFTSSYITLPLRAVYRVHEDGTINAGFYVSYRLDGNFSGYVSNGYFRQGSPVGEKLIFDSDAKASYTFKDQLSPFESGIQVGGNWRAYRHFSIFADLKYSFTNVFKSHSYMSYTNMHPLYLGLGFSYLF